MSSVKEIQSVRNACRLLEAVAAEQPIGVSGLARRTGIDKSAAHRIAVTLHRAGWLQRTTDGRWRVGSTISHVLHRSWTDTLIAATAPLLEQLRADSEETAMLVAIDHGRLLVLDVAESPHNLRITAPVGSELPLAHSSAALAIASQLPPDELEALRRLDPSLTDGALAATRRRGWALNDRAITPDTRVVGAAVLSNEGYPFAAIITCAPTSRASLADMRRLGVSVSSAARATTQRLSEEARSR
jgi:IclR family acetate operon transcriptional repressor